MKIVNENKFRDLLLLPTKSMFKRQPFCFKVFANQRKEYEPWKAGRLPQREIKASTVQSNMVGYEGSIIKEHTWLQ